MEFLKFLPLILRFRDCADAYKQETGKGKPAYISRRFVGAVLFLVAGFLVKQSGIVISDDAVSLLADNIDTAIVGAIAIYGTVLGIVGQIRKGK